MNSIKVTIPEPCHEDWDKMLPEEKGKFCLSCQKTVVDFSTMTDQEIFNYFKENNGKTCGRFSENQLNKRININKGSFIGRWKYFWQILLPAVFTVYKSNAQTITAGEVKVTTCQKDTSGKPYPKLVGKIAVSHQKQTFVKVFSMKGKVVDEHGKGIRNVTVNLKGTTPEAKVTTDSHGNFKLLASNVSLPLSINFSCDGFYSKEIEVNNNYTSQRIVLQKAERMFQGDVNIE